MGKVGSYVCQHSYKSNDHLFHFSHIDICREMIPLFYYGFWIGAGPHVACRILKNSVTAQGGGGSNIKMPGCVCSVSENFE